MSITRQTSQVFVSNGTWVAPAGVTSVIVVGFGGGGGGGGGARPATAQWNTHAAGGGGGGGGAIMSSLTLIVVPGTSYAVTIGAGGAGGNGGSTDGSDGTPGANGTDTIFGSLTKFIGASPGAAGLQNANNGGSFGGRGSRFQSTAFLTATSVAEELYQGGRGGACAVSAGPSTLGDRGQITPFSIIAPANGGALGANDGSGVLAGGGGGGGAQGGDGTISAGAGSDGGDGHFTFGSLAAAGTTAAANSGSGGGGGGGAGGGSSGSGSHGGFGGTGGSGKLIVYWTE